MIRLAMLLVVVTSLLLAACAPKATPKAAGVDEDRGSVLRSTYGLEQKRGPAGPAGPAAPAAPVAAPAAAPALPPPPPPFPPALPGGPVGAAGAKGDLAAKASAGEAAAPTTGASSGGIVLQVAQRQVISTASLAVRVEDVNGAVARVRSIAESLGGFVEHLSSSGGPERPQATVTVRVPQPQFFAALERLEALGEVQGRNVGSQDVSEQFIDLEARLKSAQRQEQSLLSLLQKAQNVTEVLTIERELTRIRGEIERVQGQLNFLERRVQLATISISLLPPKEEGGQPPSASLALEVSRVSERVEAIKKQTAALQGRIDNVSISVRNGRETAHIALRVFPKNFDQALTFIEELGEVQTKDVQQGTSGSKEPKEPNAPLTATLVEPEESNTGLIVVITAPIGGVALAGLLGFLFVTTYRAGQRKTQRS